MPEEELYDVQNDPYEVKNLAKSPAHKQVLARLRASLEHWIDESNDQGRELEPADLAARKGVTKTGTNPNKGYDQEARRPAVRRRRRRRTQNRRSKPETSSDVVPADGSLKPPRLPPHSEAYATVLGYRSKIFRIAYTVVARPARAISRVSGIFLGQTATQFWALPHICSPPSLIKASSRSLLFNLPVGS